MVQQMSFVGFAENRVPLLVHRFDDQNPDERRVAVVVCKTSINPRPLCNRQWRRVDFQTPFWHVDFAFCDCVKVSADSVDGGSTYYIDARGADRSGLARLEQMIQQTQASIQPIALQSVVSASARGII